MALQHSIELDYGIVLPEAYARISGVHHTHNELVVSVQWWSNHQARLDGKQHVKSRSFSLPWQETVSLTTAYNLLKTQGAFAGSTDA